MVLKIWTVLAIFFTCLFSSIAEKNANDGNGVHGIALQTPAGQIHVKVNSDGEIIGHDGIPKDVVQSLQNVVWELVSHGRLPIEGGVDKVPSTFRMNQVNKGNDWNIINSFVAETQACILLQNFTQIKSVT